MFFFAFFPLFDKNLRLMTKFLRYDKNKSSKRFNGAKHGNFFKALFSRHFMTIQTNQVREPNGKIKNFKPKILSKTLGLI